MQATARSIALAIALGTAGPVMAAPPGATGTGTGKFFCCHDTSGRQVCGDILPQECYGRAYRELGNNGQTVRNVEAPLTPSQRILRAAEEERRKLEEAALKEQQRKDQALLNTYSSESDIEVSHQRARNDVLKSIKNAEDRIAEIRILRKKYENEAEFYKKKRVPADIQKGLSNTDFEIKAQESIIESKKKELEIIRTKFDADHKRYLELTRRSAAQ